MGFSRFVGIDWARRAHRVCVINELGKSYGGALGLTMRGQLWPSSPAVDEAFRRKTRRDGGGDRSSRQGRGLHDSAPTPPEALSILNTRWGVPSGQNAWHIEKDRLAAVQVSMQRA